MVDSSEKNLPTTISAQADCQKCNASAQVKVLAQSVYFQFVLVKSLQVVLDACTHKKTPEMVPEELEEGLGHAHTSISRFFL